MKKTLTLACFLALPLGTSQLHAHESRYPDLHFSAFGTLGAVHSSEDRADFTSNMSVQPEGAGYSEDWSFDVDSRIGAQLTAEMTQQLSAVIQVISEQRHDDTYSPKFEWAYLQYDLTPDFSARAGRSVLPTFMVSDTRKVGFANHWVRPPVAVYGMVPVTSNDGIDISYRHHAGALTNTVQAYYGSTDIRTPDQGIFSAKESFGISGTTEFGDTLLRAAYSHSYISSDFINAFFDQYRNIEPGGEAFADRYNMDEDSSESVTLGARYDPGNWFIQGEWARVSNDSFLGTSTGWYASGGYSIGQFTPYVSYAERRMSTDSDAGLPGAGPLNEGFREFMRPNEFDTITLGVRWDLATNLSFKLQLDHFDLADDSRGELINVQESRFKPGGSLNVFSVAIDFVYW